MRKLSHFSFAVLMLVTLNACSSLGKAEATCAGPDAANVTLQIVRDQIIKLAGQTGDNQPSLSKAKIRATVKQLQLSLEDVRTSKDDPNSSKQFCIGNLKLVAPPEIVSDAEEARAAADLNSLEDLADSANVEKNANAFTKEISFNIQPTDDGQKIFSEVEDASSAFEFFAELVKDHLLKSAVEDARAEAERLAAEQQAAEESANREMQAASIEEAKATKDASEQSINAIWKALPSETRAQLLPMQRAWIKRKDATCKLEAAGNSSDQASMAVTMYNCEARENNNRSAYLQQQGQAQLQNGYYDDGSN